jgi:hypothetical protein
LRLIRATIDTAASITHRPLHMTALPDGGVRISVQINRYPDGRHVLVDETGERYVIGQQDELVGNIVKIDDVAAAFQATRP